MSNVIDDNEMRARLRPQRHAVRTAAYVPRPAVEPSRKLFQDAAVINDFQFPAELVKPTITVEVPPAPQEEPIAVRQVATVSPRQPEPSHVLMRQAVVTPPILMAEDVPELDLLELATPREPVRRTFEPPAKTAKTRTSARRRNPLRLATKAIHAFRSLSRPQQVLSTMVLLVLFIGGGLSLSGFEAGKIVKNQAAKATIASATSATTMEPTGSPPITAIVTADTLRGYHVAPNAPRYISIMKLGILARVLQAGLTKDGALAVPSNVFDTAWYRESAVPGQSGVTLINGHASSWNTNGAFYGIKDLVAGDGIEIERGDGQKLKYTVVETKTTPIGNDDMAALLKPATVGKSGLNLVTTGGKYDSKSGEFSQRIVAYATLDD